MKRILTQIRKLIYKSKSNTINEKELTEDTKSEYGYDDEFFYDDEI